MAIITFQNGKQVDVNLPATVYDAAKEAEFASREVLAAKIGDEVVALTYPLSGDTEVTLLTFADSEGEAGFVKIPDLLEKVLAEMNTQLRPSDFFYTGKKVELSRNLCLKYKSEIEKCMNEEKETVNSFIRKNAYMK